MSGRAESGAGQLHVRVPPQEVSGGHLVAFIAIETWQAPADRLPRHHDTLGAVLAVGLVARTGLEQDHGRRVLTEQPTAEEWGRNCY